MAIDKDLETALEALSRREGKSSSELLAELLGDRAKTAAQSKEPLARTGVGGVERKKTGAVTRRDEDEDESAEEAKERWLEEEAELLDGVHGLGGQSAGGIFGEGPIATSIYDPNALARGEGRVGQMANIRLSRVLERLESRLAAAPELPQGHPRRLSGGDSRPCTTRRRRPTAPSVNASSTPPRTPTAPTVSPGRAT
jgi:hypothetical protein